MTRCLLALLSFLVLSSLLALSSCHPIEEYSEDNRGDFECLWTLIDEHYCFFEEKDVDWQDVHARYAPKVNNQMTRRQLFALMAEMLAELRDGHTNLSAGFETAYYRNWWSDYPENYSARLIEEHYFHFQYKQVGEITYGTLHDNVGYVAIPSFNSSLGSGNIDWILADLAFCNGLIIDLRNNGGGNVSNAEAWARHFITEPITAAYMLHKTGPAHDDFSAPFAVEYQPATGSIWTKPVVVLTNRSTYSAANYFTAVMRALPQVTHAGATTGGGSGMPMSYDLPGGWRVRMSAVRVLDSAKASTEAGIAPHEGCAVALSPSEALAGRDSMLEFAINLINNK